LSSIWQGGVWQRGAAAAVLVTLGVLAWRAYGVAGLAALAGGLVMWALLHFTRMLHVLRRAGAHPVGFVASAVMLHAKLESGATLLQVLALTQSLGERLGAVGVEPECYRWSDASQAQVTCEFRGGKLRRWSLVRGS